MEKPTPEEFLKAKELFLKACNLPPDQREGFAAEACGANKNLLAEVRRLLVYHLPRPADQPAHRPARRAITIDAPDTAAIEVRRQSELPDFSTGQLVAGRYQIVSRLGEGAMGRVFRAVDTRLHQSVALKFLPRLHVIDPTWRKRVEREVKLSREVSHPNICRVYDLGDIDGSPYISMEFVDGEDLATLLRRVGRLTGERAIEIARQACAGLAAAHIHGVLHRDLKPANIMLDSQGRVRITDFGLAAPVGEVAKGEIRAGTPRYMAPEQIGGIAVDQKSDIYSLGLVLYEVFTGRPAFDASNIAEYVRLHRSVDPPAPSEIAPGVDPIVEAVIMACIRKDPAERPDSALSVAAALPGGDLLAAALDAGQIPTREMLADSAATRPTDRRVVLRTTMAALVLFATAVGIGLESHPICKNGGAKSSEVLSELSQQLLEESGHASIGQTAEGRFTYVSEKLSATFRSASGTPARLACQNSDQLVFTYERTSESPRSLVTDPLAFVIPGANPVRFESTSGVLARVIVDGQGRPLLLQAGGLPDEQPPAGSTPLSLGALAARAGYDANSISPAQPMLAAGFRGESHAAYLVRRESVSSDSTAQIEIEGSPDYVASFAILEPPQKQPNDSGPSIAESHYRFARSTRNLILLILLGIAIPGAWKNARGRGDLIGASRLGLFVIVLRFISSQLLVPQLRASDELIQSLAAGAVTSLCEGLIVAMFYLTIETHVRGLWPRTLGCWSRLLAGRLRDPFVARDVLVGCLFGCLWASVFYLEPRLSDWLGFSPRMPGRLPLRSFDHLYGNRFAIAGILNVIRDSIYQGLVVLFLLAITTRIAGKQRRAAIAVTWVICSFMYSLAGSNPVTAWILIAVGCVATALYLVIHSGLLSLMSALFVLGLLTHYPISLNLSAWYAGYGLFAGLCVLTLIVTGAIESLRPPPIQRRPAFLP